MNFSVKIFLLAFSALFIASCTASKRFSSDATSSSEIRRTTSEPTEITGERFLGKASYYADKFHGRQTANGEVFDQNKLTAAHRSLPFGTVVNVRNIKNNRTVTVRINDRGPFIDGRVIDLSRAAAEQLDMIRDGVVDVEVIILE